VLVVWAVLTLGLIAALTAYGAKGLAAGLAFGVLSAAGWIRFGRWAEGKVQMTWLMRSTRFILRQARGQTADLEARPANFARRVEAVLDESEVDEVLVIGHSSGAMLAVSTVARALRRRGDAAGGPALSLLTLGECIPMLSYQPGASAFRAELAVLA